MNNDKETVQELERQVNDLKRQVNGLKRRISATIRYIEREDRLGHIYGKEDIFDVVVGVLNGDIK